MKLRRKNVIGVLKCCQSEASQRLSVPGPVPCNSNINAPIRFSMSEAQAGSPGGTSGFERSAYMLQNRRPFRHFLTGLAAVAVVVATSTAQPSTDVWWTGYGNGPDNARYFASRQIDKANVDRLDVAWTYPHGDTGSSPIVVRGVVYGRGRNGSLVAVDAKTGKERWVRENMGGMTSRGINYWESADGRDQRLIFAMNGLLQQVDAKTGKSIMSFGTNGVVDLRVGIDGRDPDTIGNIQSNTPGEMFENLPPVGSATGEGYMSPPGDIRAYDVLTGKLVWTFHTVPRPGEFGYETWPKDAWKYVGGTNNWGEMTIDTPRGIAYVPLGSPTYDFYGADRTGANLFGTSIVALNARTGKRLWHFQLVHHDLWDMDPSAAPQLTTIRHNGRNRDVVVVTSEDRLAVRVRSSDGRANMANRRAAGSEERDGRGTELADAALSDQSAAVHQAHIRRVETSAPPALRRSARRSEAAGRRGQQGIFTPISYEGHRPRAGEQRRHAVRRRCVRSSQRRGLRRRAREPGIVRLLRPGEGRGGGGAPPLPPGRSVYQQNCQSCHGSESRGRAGRRLALVHVAPIRRTTSSPVRRASTPRPSEESLRPARGACPRFRTSRATDLDNLVTFLTTAWRGSRRAAPGRGRGPRWSRHDCVGCTARADCRVRIGLDAARSARRTRTRRGDTVSGGHAGLHALHDQRVQHGRQSHQAAVHDNREVRLERASDQVAHRLRRRSGARGARHHGHRRAGGESTASSSPNRASLFGAGLDNHIRAWDSDTGKQLWSSRFGGSFTGSPVMYLMSGTQYLLVAAASTVGPPANGAASTLPTAPMGWVAYTLPTR